MRVLIGLLYCMVTGIIALVLLRNFLNARDTRKMILYAAVSIPFILRVLRIK